MSSPHEMTSIAKGPIAWMAVHSVAANLVMLLCLISGLMMIPHITQEVFPDLTLDIVEVQVAYPGASPEEVERGILLAIEEQVQGLDGVKEVSSVASEGSGVVRIEATLGASLQKLAGDVQNEVDRITTFPEEAEESRVRILSRKREIMSLAVYANSDESTLHEVTERLRQHLLMHPKLSQVSILGLRPLEISVDISQDDLRRYGLSLESVATYLRNASLERPGGSVKSQDAEVLLRMSERRDFGDGFRSIPLITSQDGSSLRLEDIATISDGYEDRDMYSTYNSKPSLALSIYRSGKQTPLEIVDAVQKQLASFSFPKGFACDIMRDRSKMFRDRVDLLVRNGLLGLCLVFIGLSLFLEIRLAFWVMMGIPISFLGAFVFMPMTGVSINMVSLFAFLIALGIVVDDAIVAGENIYHYRQKGHSFMESAILGIREVATPIVFSILTNIVTFLPLYFIPGMIGKIFSMIPVVVILVFTISLFESIFILPAHLAHGKDRSSYGIFKKLEGLQQKFSGAFMRWVKRVYEPFLGLTIRYRYITIAIAVSFLMISISYAKSGRMGFDMFPQVESDFARADLSLPYGSPVQKTKDFSEKICLAARQVAEEAGHMELITGISSEIGRSGGHELTVNVSMADPEIRDEIMSTSDFVKKWRKKVGSLQGIDSLRFVSDSGGPGGGPAVSVELRHHNLTVLEKASKELAEELSLFPKVSDVDDGYQEGKEQFDFTIKPEGISLGLNANLISRQIRNAFYGAEVTRQQRGRNEIKILVRLPKHERTSMYELENMRVLTPKGDYVPLYEVSEVRRGHAFTSITRREGSRTLTVSADVSPRDKAGEVNLTLKEKILPDLESKYPGLKASFEGRSADMRESMSSLLTTYPLALIGIYLLLAIPFKSYVQPLIVMTCIPFGVVGALLGHLIMGYSLSVISMLGIVALSGVVVNDSLVLIDFTNRRRLDKLGAEEALRDAAVQRFRPILMTTMTTFFGLMPMIFETSRQAKFLIPMAISLGFGIVFATLITLILVPSLYMLTEDSKRLWAFTWGKA